MTLCVYMTQQIMMAMSAIRYFDHFHTKVYECLGVARLFHDLPHPIKYRRLHRYMMALKYCESRLLNTALLPKTGEYTFKRHYKTTCWVRE